MNSEIDVKNYYRRITEQDIGAIARELLTGRITQETSHTLMCDCPNHQSQSKRSLQIMLDKQGWYCFGCGTGGDVLQLVEFIQSGTVTSGHSGPMPESHRKARDFLAGKAGLPPLSAFGLTPEELMKYEETRRFEERVKLALTSLAKLYHKRLKENSDALKWIKENYNIADEIIDKYLIGYADNSGGSWGNLIRSDDKFSMRELAATGAFCPTREDKLMPFFDKRIIFPYWSRGSVVFMIGRKTQWTPENQYEQGKYKKLLIHNEERKHIAPFINNSVLYNEDCLLSQPERVVITEGVTDCIALMQADFPAISPATVRFRNDDWKRIIPKLRGVKKVYICQDNELSEAGLRGAVQSSKIISENNIDIRLITLPLDEKQLSARKELEEKFNCKTGIVSSELKELLKAMSEAEKAAFEKLQADAKTDVNEYFLTGHSKDDFEALIEKSLTPLEFAINNIPDNISEEERNHKLEVVFEKIAWEAPVEQGRMLRLLRDRWKNLSMAEMREQLRIAKKKRKVEASAKKIKKIIQREYPKASGKPMIELPYSPVKINGVVIPGRTDAEFTHDLFTVLAHLKAFYNYAGNIVQISELKRKDYRTGHEQQITGFDNVKPAGFVVDVEKYADLGVYMTDETDEKVFVKSSLKRCPAENALTSVAAKTLLPNINGITKIRLPYIYKNELKFTPSGFDENTGLWTDTLAPEVITIPLEDAKKIIHEVFSEFCFLERELDIARALAYLLTPMLRAIIGSNRAMVFLASGNRPGVGKDYLLGLAPLIYTGEEQPFCAPCNDDDEYRKQIFSICAAGEQFFLISNLKGHLASPALEQAASLPFFSGRMLGKSEQRTYPNLAVYGLSSNGLTISEDMERRILDIRLEFYEEKIKERKFRNSNLHEYIKSNRPEILSALYSFIIHWYKSGAPDGESKIPNFSEWSRMISGILTVCGFMNPFSERKKITASMQGSGNRDDDNLRSLCVIWFKRYGQNSVDAGTLRNLAEENGLFQYLDFSERKHQVGFSKLFLSRSNRHYAGLKICAGVSRKYKGNITVIIFKSH